MMLKTGTLCL